ncbi:MAG TPA: STAS domain-containing protein [Armatimonadota bacterium]|nr:STAS domain-containing protein [Armatimonadota bacterium]HOM70880.1 STAS domain-containing protein [Armatimonadota bacterium]HOP79465.1 STAS domain-containing protein [Armatimonadota bacterium]
MMEMDLRIKTRIVEGVPVIELSGELDSYTCSQFRDAMIDIIEQGHPSVVVSMAEVEYIDSSGLGTLVGGLKRASEKGGRIAVVCRSNQIRKVFEITGLEKVFPLFEDETEAARSLAA